MQAKIQPEENRHIYEDRRWKPAHRRLLGFLRYLLNKNESSIWVQVKPETFCELTGLSDRTFWRALRRIREEAEEHGLVFRTINSKGKKDRCKNWKVLVARDSQLLFDKEPLFYDLENRYRYVRPSLREPCIEKPEPATEVSDTPISEGNHPRRPTLPLKRITESPRGKRSDIPFKEVTPADHRINTPGGNSGGQRPRRRPKWTRKRITEAGLARLEKLAHWLARHRLQSLHWDNCRISYHHLPAFGFALRCLRQGHTRERIEKAYLAALRRAHGYSVDLEVSDFTLASTFSHAYDLLRDGRTTGQRVETFYDNRRREVAELRDSLREILRV